MEERNQRKVRAGVVVSDKMDKTVVVAVLDKIKHPIYKKTMNKTKKYKVRNIPTILFMKNGEVVDKHVGSTNEGDLRKKLEALL